MPFTKANAAKYGRMGAKATKRRTAPKQRGQRFAVYDDNFNERVTQWYKSRAMANAVKRALVSVDVAGRHVYAVRAER